jgi:hypothetical protein
MYLLKLRYGNHFGNRGGSTWRLLFVYALMPWMHKYRIAARSGASIRNQHDGVTVYYHKDSGICESSSRLRFLDRILKGIFGGSDQR